MNRNIRHDNIKLLIFYQVLKRFQYHWLTEIHLRLGLGISQLEVDRSIQ